MSRFVTSPQGPAPQAMHVPPHRWAAEQVAGTYSKNLICLLATESSP